MIKKLLEEHITENVKDDIVAVLMSGGVDSLSVAFAAHDVGKRVVGFTFCLEGNETYDYLKAKEVCADMGWECNPFHVPTTNLVDDWHRLVKLGCRKKTHFETVFPFLYVYPDIYPKYVLTGWGADGYFGPSKKAMMRYSNDKKWDNYTKYCKEHNQKQLTFNEFRIEYLDGDCAGYKEHTNLAEHHNKIHIAPYKDSKKIRELLMSKSWFELNKPRQKEIIRKDFTNLEKYGTIKPHINLHLGANIHKLFETLLDDEEINIKNRKRMMDVCRDWYEKEKEFMNG
tara:strand:- start:39 stop:893 length:855 start_codon:yes stop_codon:yes gene_type:complete